MSENQPFADVIATKITDAVGAKSGIEPGVADRLAVAGSASRPTASRPTAVRPTTSSWGATQARSPALTQAGPSSRFVPLWPSGLAVTPELFDFSALKTSEQLSKAARFARLVNAVPLANEKYWTQTGSETWDIWQMLLDNIELPSGSLGNAEISRLKGEMSISEKADPTGATFYFTDYWPQNFWENEAAWMPLSLSENDLRAMQGEPRAGIAPGDLLTLKKEKITLKAKVTQIKLTRSWWEPYIFASRNWRLRPGSLASSLSDGETPTSGSMTMFATALVIAKDIEVKITSDAPNRDSLAQAAETAANLSLGPFALKGRAKQGTDVDWSPDVKMNIEGVSLRTDGMQVVGFMCLVLPKCPNPSPDLYWGSSGSISVKRPE